jgi:ADP-heptose:LPS heptosyltransferase
LRPALPQSREIIVVRVDNIGDFVLWLDGARAIRKHYPRGEWRITLLASSAWAAFAEASHLFDEIIAFERSRYFFDSAYRRTLFRRLAERRFGIAIAPTYSRNPAVDDLLIRATGAELRLGHEGDDAHADPISEHITDRWYSRLISGGGGVEHELAKNLIFARQFDDQAELRMPRLEPSMIVQPGWVPVQEYFVVAPGVSTRIRQWPVERFAEVMRSIQKKTGWMAVICGSAQDRELGETLAERTDGSRVVNACGQSNLMELAGVVARARLVLTNDTAATHIGAAVGVPTITILGGGDFGRFAPYPKELMRANRPMKTAYFDMPCFHCNWQCRLPHRRGGPAPCIQAVTTEDVLTQLDALLLLPR